ncbi:hypothetical protein Q6A58_15980 [Pseudomonas aeruginosa]|nr:hypothetical protein [Pseudomonas aeruginosa]MDO7915968.1 hypothetical protein [Pseudomonas aeruginosa]
MSRAPASAKLFLTPPAAEARHVPHPSPAAPYRCPGLRPPGARRGPATGQRRLGATRPGADRLCGAERFPRAVESGTACDIGLYVHDELVGNLQPGASLALNLQPGAVDVRLAPNGPGDACRNGMTILAGQTLTLRAGEIRNLRITLGAGGLYLAPVADGY